MKEIFDPERRIFNEHGEDNELTPHLDAFGMNRGKQIKPWVGFADNGRLGMKPVIVHTEPSREIELIGDAYKGVGEGYVVAQEQQSDGSWTWLGIHISRILGK